MLGRRQQTSREPVQSRPQFPSQFSGTGTADRRDTLDGTMADVTYMPGFMDGMDSILI